LAAAYVAGAAIDWTEVQRPHGARRVPLPTYPFERQSYWVETAAPGASVAHALSPQAAPSAALRGRRLPHALPSFELLLRADAPSWLGQHRLHGAVLVPGPVFVEFAAKSAADVWGGAPTVCAFEVHAPLVVPDAGALVQLHFLPHADDDTQRFEIHSRAAGGPDAEWLRHASGRIALGDAAPPSHPALPLAQLAKDLGASASCTPHYQRLRELGIELGPVFASLQEAHRRNGAVLARLQLADEALADDVALAHPGLLDGALQAAGLALPPQPPDGSVYLLTGVQAMQWGRMPLPPSLWCQVRLRDADGDPHPTQWRADVTLHDDSGAWLGLLQGVTLRRAARESLQRIAAQAQPGAAHDAIAALGYQITWEPAPAAMRAARDLLSPTQHATRVATRFEALAAEHGLAVYDTLLPQLDRLSASYVALALRQLGFADVPGRELAADTEARALGIVAAQRRLFARLLQMLAEDGALAKQGGGYVVRHRLEDVTAVQLGARHDTLVKQHAPVDGELSMLRRCGDQLARVLRGEQDPLQLLFPAGSFAEARKLYVESPYARTYNGALAAAIEAATARLPAHARLRVLEIGAGTGGTTSAVLPLLDGTRTDYTFTDLSPLFLERAAEAFRAYPFVARQMLDIERDPQGQGFAKGRYDIVVAANVLHACADLAQAVRHARWLLADGGQLLLLEGLVRSRWVDLSFGLTDGWWRFTDAALRTDYPLIARAAWQQLLAQNGFGAIAMHPPEGSGARAQQALIAAQAAAPARRWHLAGGPLPIVQALQLRLQAHGHAVTTGGAGELPAAPVDACVYLGALEAVPDDDAAAVSHCESHAVQKPLAQLAHAARGAGRIWLVTQGVQRLPGDAATPAARWSAPLWGLARGFALEHPQCWGAVIDLPPAAAPDVAADALLRSFDADDDEDQVAWRGGVRHAARLVQQPLTPTLTPAPTLRGDVSYLVSGGFGGLGLQVAGWLADQGVRHLALLGRRPDADAPALQALRARGVQVLAIAADVADAAQLNTLPQRLLDAHAPPLAGIFHLAADLGAAPIAELDAARVHAMLRPKVAGTVALQALARAHRIELLVLFSTTTALLGAAGLAHYAAANAFLDASAEHASAGTHTLSINWGTWEAMRLASVSDRQQFRAAGLLPMRNADALAAMGRLLGARATRGVVAAVDWPQLKALHEARRARPLLRRIGAAEPALPKSSVAPAHSAAQALIERLRAAPAAQRRDLLVDFVQTQVSAVLALPEPGSVALHTGLFDLGMDSLMAVELKRRLERGVGKPLPSTLTFNYPNVSALALFLDNQLADTLVQAAGRDATTAAPAWAAAETSATGELDALSDEELETRLMAALEKAR
jgi:acyl transferase domain-containing protein/acyl carrier protein